MNTKETIDAILAETGKAVLGKDDVLRRILTAILAGGHILIDDIPGAGNSTPDLPLAGGFFAWLKSQS